MFSSSCCSLIFEQIIDVRCTSVSIKLVSRFVGPNESQRKYRPVKVGFLKTEVKNPSLRFSTKTSKNDDQHDESDELPILDVFNKVWSYINTCAAVTVGT